MLQMICGVPHMKLIIQISTTIDTPSNFTMHYTPENRAQLISQGQHNINIFLFLKFKKIHESDKDRTTDPIPTLII